MGSKYHALTRGWGSRAPGTSGAFAPATDPDEAARNRGRLATTLPPNASGRTLSARRGIGGCRAPEAEPDDRYADQQGGVHGGACGRRYRTGLAGIQGVALDRSPQPAGREVPAAG